MEFPKDLSSFAIYFLIFSSMFTSFVTAAFGIGGGAISLGFLAIYLNPIYLLPVHGAVQIGSNFGRTLLMLKDVQKEPIIPFLIKDPMETIGLRNRLLEKGILVGAVRPPTVPRNTSRLRISLHTGVEESLVDEIISLVNTWKKN